MWWRVYESCQIQDYMLGSQINVDLILGKTCPWPTAIYLCLLKDIILCVGIMESLLLLLMIFLYPYTIQHETFTSYVIFAICKGDFQDGAKKSNGVCMTDQCQIQQERICCKRPESENFILGEISHLYYNWKSVGQEQDELEKTCKGARFVWYFGVFLADQTKKIVKLNRKLWTWLFRARRNIDVCLGYVKANLTSM